MEKSDRKEIQLKALAAAHKKREAMKAQGIKTKQLNPIEKAIANPKSLAMAVRAYWWDWAGCTMNPVTKELREDAKGGYNKSKSMGLRKAVNKICLECAGGGTGGDPGGRERVRDCEFTDCSLWKLRSYQNVTGRKPRNPC